MNLTSRSVGGGYYLRWCLFEGSSFYSLKQKCTPLPSLLPTYYLLFTRFTFQQYIASPRSSIRDSLFCPLPLLWHNSNQNKHPPPDHVPSTTLPLNVPLSCHTIYTSCRIDNPWGGGWPNVLLAENSFEWTIWSINCNTFVIWKH